MDGVGITLLFSKSSGTNGYKYRGGKSSINWSSCGYVDSTTGLCPKVAFESRVPLRTSIYSHYLWKPNAIILTKITAPISTSLLTFLWRPSFLSSSNNFFAINRLWLNTTAKETTWYTKSPIVTVFTSNRLKTMYFPFPSFGNPKIRVTFFS